ncbi:branched-chain amino acid ABC transporter permease [Phreatobacter sp.]|uniref:branched-chain amino acid ABC transporter permease n=1 Tax=Phreatobacter sp. TaxID=1966341 RepID=UPI0025F9D3C4|nr:branched-chain amino acid ABC transporter permease [Phreatobacter sp.]
MLALPIFVNSYQLGLANFIFINIVAVLGLNVITGFTGQISIGHGAFLGAGAYASAYLVSVVGVPFLVAMPAAGLVAAVVGSLFGIPSVRLKGLYLASATLAAQFILEFVFKGWTSVTGGTLGMSAGALPIFGYEIHGDLPFFWRQRSCRCSLCGT